MNLHVSQEIAELVERAAAISVHRGQYFVGVEHLFTALLEHPDLLPVRVRDTYLHDLFAVLREVSRTPWAGPGLQQQGEVAHTARCIATLSAAGKLARRSHSGSAGTAHVLLALLGDDRSAPSRCMDALDLGRTECLKMLRDELFGTLADFDQPAQTDASSPSPAPHASAAPAAPELTRNLSDLARAGGLNPVIGRNEELFEILQVLTRQHKNNVMLVGEAGVGKTQLVEGFALELTRRGKAAGWPEFEVLELSMAAMMAGTQYRGAFEEKVLALLNKLRGQPNTILFIDEIHLIMGAGSTEGGSVDLANLLKPALARGEIRCIGATTVQEYRRFVEKDAAIERRFQMVRVEELTEAATLQVLQRLRPSLERHHKLRISSRALEAAVALTQRHLPHLRLPDKAIDVVDQACARRRLQMLARPEGQPEALPQAEKLTPHDVRKVVSQIAGIPLEELTERERMHLNDLERNIRKRLLGQDEAVAKVVATVKKSRAGMADPNRPDAVMLFLGPSGVGKTQLAKLLAENLFGSRTHLVTFDMSEYVEEHAVARLLGAPPGYVGHGEEGRLTQAVQNAPFSVLLFDEIEKAHPRIFDIFLPIFDEGRLKDSRGREANFKNCIIILTSNIGAELLAESTGPEVRRKLLEALRGHFRPEFINRIDEIVPFHPLLAEDIRSILRLELKLVKERLEGKKMQLRIFQQAYEYLGREGYNPDMGARELRRVVDQRVTVPISEMILDGNLQPGDMVEVFMDGERLTVRRGERASSPAREVVR